MRTAEESLGYPVTERTRFLVRVEIHEDLSGTPRVDWVRGCHSLEEAQRAYVALREETGYGASQFGFGSVFDEAGQLIATVSYNGRLWAPDPDGLVWRPGAEPVAEAPAMTPEQVDEAIRRLRAVTDPEPEAGGDTPEP